MRAVLLRVCRDHDIRGTLILAAEGIKFLEQRFPVADLIEPGIKGVTGHRHTGEDRGKPGKYRVVVHGRVDLRKFIEKSCNVTGAILAQRLGSQKLYDHIKTLGFLDKTGIELIGETNGWLQRPDKEKWAPMKTANVGFGLPDAVNAYARAAK